MPGWSWWLIWGGLSLLLLALLAGGAWWLFRKLMRVFGDLDDLAAKLELLEVAELETEARAYELAAIAKLSDVRMRREAVREAATQRRWARSQRRLDRAKLITTADPTQRT